MRMQQKGNHTRTHSILDVATEAEMRGLLDALKVPEGVDPHDILLDVGGLLVQRLAIELLALLPVQHRGRFHELLFQGDGDALRAFLCEHISGLDERILLIIEREMAAIRLEMSPSSA